MKKSVSLEIPSGTIRIGSRDLRAYERVKDSWKQSEKEFPEANNIVHLFKVHNNISTLKDSKNPQFLKGQISPDGKIQGARIDVLPDGEKLDKAYSIFAKNLTVHDESSNSHWDVIYQNPNGKYAYVYTINKKNKAKKRKYSKVDEFDKIYHKLESNVIKNLGNPKDYFAVPMFTLLKTLMRVGNEIYYKAHKHKGLTTLKKSDISINKNNVSFHYFGKNGVPMIINDLFPDAYVRRLKASLNKLKPSDFVFTNPDGSTIKDTQFMKAFLRYSGKEFYPHIVRSHYATKEVRKFLKTHRSAKKKEVKELFNGIAERLGHKRFSKKDNEWVDSSAVTIHYYVEPSLVEKVRKITE